MTELIYVNAFASFWQSIRASAMGTVFNVFKWILFAFSILLLLYLLLTITPCGRMLWAKMKFTVYLNSLVISMKQTFANQIAVFLLLSILHVPLVSILFSSFACDQVTCTAGTQFPTKYFTVSASSFERSYNNSRTGICQTCSFFQSNSTTGSKCNITNLVCPNVTSTRLIADYGLACLTGMTAHASFTCV